MFIIFGTRRMVSRLGVAFLLCRFCSSPAAHPVSRVRTFFTLFFIPLVPMSTRYVTTCTMCGKGSQITKEAAEQFLAGPERPVDAAGAAPAGAPAFGTAAFAPDDQALPPFGQGPGLPPGASAPGT